MRLPRVRFTVRRMVVVVAVLGPVLWAERLRALSHEYEGRAYRHAYAEETEDGRYCALYLSIDFDKERACWLARPPDGQVTIPEETVDMRRRASHHRMYHKWRDAAQWPWLSVQADPPEPD